MGCIAISHDGHIEQRQRDQDRSLDQAVQRDAELEDTRLERVVEVRQLTYARDKPPR